MSLKCCLIMALCSFNLFAQTIKVGLEPFPPIINRDGTGIAIDLLNRLSQQSALSFNIQLMTYGRAKKELAQGHLDLIGISPKGFETKSFYYYAEELNWSFNTTLDIFSVKQDVLRSEKFESGTIGTLIGNADFMAEVTSISRDRFVEVTNLQQLAKMLHKGRINAVIFERVAMMKTINRLGLTNIYYQKIRSIPASFSINKNGNGLKLKKQLDELFNQFDSKVYLTPYIYYNQLDENGLVGKFTDKKSANN